MIAFLACLSSGYAAADEAFFESNVRPLLVKHCYECHSGTKTMGGLSLDTQAAWQKGGDTGPAIVPGNPGESLLIEAVNYVSLEMPPPDKAGKLSADNIAILTKWVAMGAHDPRVAAAKLGGMTMEDAKSWWAFQPVIVPVVPESAFPEISRSPIDAFLFAAMSKHDLRPATRTDRATLLRRATFDLTGLPPTVEAVTAFVHDAQPDDAAFAQVVETLLASPAYGEKWGRFWLDLAHYADTTGCSSDWPIDDMWRYRDWVIAAFNDDKPFDRFLTEQLAGDLLAADMLKQSDSLDEKVYRERIVATGFLATAKRFGSDPGAYDHLTIGDSLDATWKAFQGLTIGCARCHDHKFDPLTHVDYYALYGIFASSVYPYSGAEKNQEASLLVPLARQGKTESVLDAWNRELRSSGDKRPPRSVLASFNERWSFEDNETSEDVSDRAPMNPWVSKGGIAVRAGNSPFVHLVPKGGKLVDFQATALQGEMIRRVRWQDEQSDVRSLAVDFQLASLWDDSGHRLKLAWRSQDEPSEEVELADIAAGGLSVPGGDKPVLLDKARWYHLTLFYALQSSTLTTRLWDESGRLLADSRLPSEVATKLRAPGNLIVRFEADAVNDNRQACVRMDNIVADSVHLPAPASPAFGPAAIALLAHSQPMASALAKEATRSLSAAQVNEGASVSFADGQRESLLHIQVRKGEVIQLTVSPNASHGADSTLVEWAITETTGTKRKWSVADLVQSLTQGNPHADKDGASWCFLDVTDGLKFLHEKGDSINDHLVLKKWSIGSEPSVFVNTADQPVMLWTNLAAESFFVHPGVDRPVAVAWVSPLDGQVSISGRVTDAHPFSGDGVSFQLDHIAAPEFGPALVSIGAALMAAEANKPTAVELEAVYRAVVQRKPETAFAMWEGTPHDVALQKRGEPESPGIVVLRRNLEIFGGQPVEHPSLESGRRDLARWMLDESNPLTLRVFVNRLWQGHFGRGIVTTPNDFGHKGDSPTHPELLNYLVGQFRKNGLSIKAMHREIMLSHAYRQSSGQAAGSQDRDPDNRWLSHFSPRRLAAEEVRDSVLFVSAVLDNMGPGYRQPFPQLDQRNWNQHGPFSLSYEANYGSSYEHRKRSIYLPVVRLVADPFLSTFDIADSNQSVAMRGETAVPLQALALQNAPFIIEAANTLAALAAKQSSDADAVRFLYRQIFGIAASDSTENKLTAHLTKMTTEQGLKRDEGLAIIAQSLMASNAFLYVF